MHRSLWFLLLLGLTTAHASERAESQKWFAAGANTALERLGGAPGQARNLIIFVGDGMGPSTVTAARILQGQQRGGTGEEHWLSFERLPHSALIKTYNTDRQTPDSAGAMTAIMSGVKSRFRVIGLGPEAETGNCAQSRGHELLSLLQLAELASLSTGIVSTTRLTHATPAATFAHSPHRDWEADVDLPPEAAAQGCVDIARQLIEFPFGDGLEVALGGGRERFLPMETKDPEYPELRGQRGDGRDLTQEWRASREGSYVWDQAGFDAFDATSGRPLLGLFEPSHMQFDHDRSGDTAGEPSLAEMTAKALDMLQPSRRGYVLMVEGGRIDHGHHEANAFRALTDTIAFADAVQVALDRTDVRDTLILVTADHSHTLSISGYPDRGNPILGLVRHAGKVARDDHGHAYTTLAYANGPGHRQSPPQLSDAKALDPNYMQEALRPRESETHGGEDVAAYARGPGAASLRGVLEQNALYHLMLQNVPALAREQCRLAPNCRRGRGLDHLPEYPVVKDKR